MAACVFQKRDTTVFPDQYFYVPLVCCPSPSRTKDYFPPPAPEDTVTASMNRMWQRNTAWLLKVGDKMWDSLSVLSLSQDACPRNLDTIVVKKPKLADMEKPHRDTDTQRNWVHQLKVNSNYQTCKWARQQMIQPWVSESSNGGLRHHAGKSRHKHWTLF